MITIIKDVAFLMQDNFYELANADKQPKSTLAVALIRDALLPEILGADNNILYWAGKRLARNFPIAKDEEIPVFFEQADWGELKRIKSKKDQQYFQLTGDVVKMRQKLNPRSEFLLEAGFLAETIQNQLGFITEVVIDKKTHDSVTFLAQIDSKDAIDLDSVDERKPLTIEPLSLDVADEPEAEENDKA